MGRTVSFLRTVAAALLLLVMLSVIFGCVNGETTPDRSDETEQPDGEAPSDLPTDNNGEQTAGKPENPDDTIEKEDPDDSAVDSLIPDEEQVDQNGFPNPPEEDATKRY